MRFAIVRGVRRGATAVLSCAASVAMLAALGCGDTTAVPQLSAGTPSTLFATVTASPVGINIAMSPAGYDTVRLHVAARNAAGTTLDISGVTPRFTSLDTTRVYVDSTGLITARALADAYSPVKVAVSVTLNGVTHSDTAFVRVASTAPSDVLGSLSVQPFSEAAAVWPLGSFTASVFATTLAADESPYSDGSLLIAFRSSDGRIAGFNISDNVAAAPQGVTVSPNAPGTVWMTASTYAFGVSLMDSAQYRVDSVADVHIVQIRQRQGTNGVEYFFFPDTVSLLSGQTILWTTLPLPETADSVSVTFSDPSVALPAGFPYFFFVGFDAGNIAPLPPRRQLSAGRSFATLGTYTYTDGHGATGVIIVNPAP